MLLDVLLPRPIGVVNKNMLFYGLGVVLIKDASVLLPLADLLAALIVRVGLRGL